MSLASSVVGIFVDFNFEDMEVMYPKMRLEEEGAIVMVFGTHPKGTKYTGKFGYVRPSGEANIRRYPVISTHCIDSLFNEDGSMNNDEVNRLDALVIPGGFAPDYMRRSAKMLQVIVFLSEVAKKPVAAICHGPWMFCSARHPETFAPIVKGRKCTAFVAIKDDVINAGAAWTDEKCVVDETQGRCLISAQTPNELGAFCRAIITGILSRRQ